MGQVCVVMFRCVSFCCMSIVFTLFYVSSYVDVCRFCRMFHLSMCSLIVCVALCFQPTHPQEKVPQRTLGVVSLFMSLFRSGLFHLRLCYHFMCRCMSSHCVVCYMSITSFFASFIRLVCCVDVCVICFVSLVVGGWFGGFMFRLQTRPTT